MTTITVQFRGIKSVINRQMANYISIGISTPPRYAAMPINSRLRAPMPPNAATPSSSKRANQSATNAPPTWATRVALTSPTWAPLAIRKLARPKPRRFSSAMPTHQTTRRSTPHNNASPRATANTTASISRYATTPATMPRGLASNNRQFISDMRQRRIFSVTRQKLCAEGAYFPCPSYMCAEGARFPSPQ